MLANLRRFFCGGTGPDQAPTVSAGSNQSIILPAIASLSGTANDDGKPVGSVLSYIWSKVSGPGSVAFNGNPTANTLATPASFSVAGEYVLKLTASDSVLSSESTVTITVQPVGTTINVPPVAVISANPQSGTAPLNISFNSSGSNDPDGTIASYAWNFGDGGTATGPTASHTYSSNGSYTARLTVTDNRGGTHSATIPITLSLDAPPIISAISSFPTYSSATITWTTNEVADTQVEYGTSASYGQSTTPNTSMTKSHAATIAGLNPSTSYHYRVKSKDSAGGLTISADQTFATGARPANPGSAQVIDAGQDRDGDGNGDNLLKFPSSALWNSMISFRPGNGEVADINPPRFSWTYNPDPKTFRCFYYCEDNAPKEFIFQISRSNNFDDPANLLVNVRIGQRLQLCT